MAVATRALFTGPVPDAIPRPPLWPDLAVDGVKDVGNPTFAFDAIPENIVKVESTYWCVYQSWSENPDVIRLATASDPDGPWTSEGTFYELTDIPWATVDHTTLYAPFIMEHEGTFHLFYSVCESDGSDGHSGYATSTTIDGTYTDHGSPILSPAASGWTSRRIGELSVMFVDGRWYVAAMAETLDVAFGSSEKIGIWTGASLDTLTAAAGNPLIDHGANTTWDDDLIADPHLLRANGLWWIMYAGGGSVGGTGTRKWHQGLAYATTPTGAWTKHPSNPVLSAGSSGFDEMAAWRGSLFVEDGIVYGVYGGLDADLSDARGGNFRLEA